MQETPVLDQGTDVAPINPRKVLELFDRWFFQCWCDLPADPRTAPSSQVACCTYQQWFAPEGSEGVDPLASLGNGRWEELPSYVCAPPVMSRDRLRSLSSLRLRAHDLEVEVGKWQRSRDASGRWVAQAVPRPLRKCRLCGEGVGDEYHMIMECQCYLAVRELHAPLFEAFGGWQHLFTGPANHASLRQFMRQPARRVGAFLFDCARRRWSEPPDELVFADCEDADASDSTSEQPVEAHSDEYVDAWSEEFFDTYSDEFFECCTP